MNPAMNKPTQMHGHCICGWLIVVYGMELEEVGVELPQEVFPSEPGHLLHSPMILKQVNNTNNYQRLWPHEQE